MHAYVCYIIPSLFTTWVPCLLNNLYIPNTPYYTFVKSFLPLCYSLVISNCKNMIMFQWIPDKMTENEKPDKMSNNPYLNPHAKPHPNGYWFSSVSLFLFSHTLSNVYLSKHTPSVYLSTHIHTHSLSPHKLSQSLYTHSLSLSLYILPLSLYT